MEGRVAGSLSISCVTLSAIMAIASFLTPVSAQTADRLTARTPRPEDSRGPEGPRPPSIREREFVMLAMEMEAGKPLTREEKKLALTQIAEDFARIQVINNKMMSTAMSAAVPDYGSIADTTAEIEKRATRIKTNLRLPDKEDPGETPPEYKSVVDPRGLKASLLLLDARIMSFINNPIFKNTSVVEVGEAAKAKRDLDTIVEFSGRIGKDAKKLSKSSDKRP